MEVTFFFWLAHPCLEGGLLGDPCRKGAGLLRLHYWPGYSGWAAAELVSLEWETVSQERYSLRCFWKKKYSFCWVKQVQKLHRMASERICCFEPWSFRVSVITACCNITFCNAGNKKSAIKINVCKEAITSAHKQFNRIYFLNN